jgi:uncharacterized repeat protein (TIGR01451 family)
MPLRRRSIFLPSALITLAAIGVIGAATALACVTNSYSVTSSAPPPSGNWTDTSGALWTPGGGFPGCSTGDTASDTNASPTTIIVNSVIPNPIVGLNLGCNGCVIDVQPGGQLTLAGPGTIASGATLRVSGGSFVVASGGNLTFDSGSSLDMTAGTLSIQNGGQVNVNDGSTSGGGGAINNAGTLQMNGTSFTVNTVLNNLAGASGVFANSGTLSLASGGSGDAPFTIASGATLDFPSGSYTMTPNGTVSGGGTLAVSGGTLSIGGVTAPTNFAMSAGTLTGAGFLSVAGPFDWSGGTITGSGGTEIAGTGVGTFTGANGPMVLDGRSFNDYGYVSFMSAANPLQLTNAAAFSVYGTFDFTCDGSITTDGSATAFNVAPNGLLVKSGGGGTSMIASPAYNSASVLVSIGTLEFSGGGSHSGCFFPDAAGTLAFSTNSSTISGCVFGGGTVSFPSASTFISGFYDVGTTSITGGFVTIDSGMTTDFLLDGGTLDLTGSFTMTGSGTWSNGTIEGISGAETFLVDTGATLTIDAANGIANLAAVVFENDGTVNYTATATSGNYLQLMSGATIHNTGTFDIQDNQPIRIAVIIIGTGVRPLAVSPIAINNDGGTWKKSAGSGTNDIDPPFSTSGTVLASTGTMHFVGGYTQTGGTTTLGLGGISADSTVQFQGGTLNGTGTIAADVQNDGAQISPKGSAAAGTINITGNYTQGSGGSLYMSLFSDTALDQLAIGGIATLDGTLIVTVDYTPADGTTWPILTFASRSGDFAVKNLPTYPPSGSIVAIYTPTELDLKAVVAAQANLAITKNGPAGVVAGQNVTYTVQVTNNGPAAAANVQVSDPQPANLTFVSNSGACTSAYPCNLGTLNNGQTVTITSTYSTSPSFSGNVTNTATVSSTTPDPDNSNNSASATTNVGAQSDLSISKSGPPSVAPGQNITYTITFKNNGPSPATNTIVSDPTPVGIAFVSNSGACTTPFPCNVGTLSAGQTASITSTYTVPATYTGATVTNTATISSDVNDPTPTNNSSSATTAVAQQADVSIVKTGPPSAAPGSPVVYTITVSNLGPSAAANVQVSDPTPAGLTFVSNSGACTSTFPCNLGTLNAGQSAAITTTFNVPSNYAGTTITNTANVTTAANDPNSGNDSSSVTTPVTGQADVGITKMGPATTTPGSNVVYTVTVTNNGPLSAANVFVNDPTPTGLNFVSNSGACSGPYPCALGTLNPSQSVTITTTYNVPANFAGTTISNTATVSSSTADLNPTNNSATATTSLTGTLVADLTVTKKGPATALENTVATFTITVSNGGPNAAQNVVVSDPTPVGTTFIANSGGCTTPYPCNLGTLAPGQSVTITSKYHVDQGVRGSFFNTASASSSATDPNPNDNSSTVIVRTQAPLPCPTKSPAIVAPANNATVTSPVTLSWSAVPNALSYLVTINGSGAPAPIATTLTSISVPLPPGPFTWGVIAFGPNNSCLPLGSGVSSFTVCGPPAAPLAGVVGETTTGQTYSVSWDAVDFAVSYDLDEALEPTFASPQTTSLTGTSKSFTKNVNLPTAFFYRVRAKSVCSDVSGYSPTISVVVIPGPQPNALGPTVNAPAGSTTPISFQIFIPGLPGGTTSFLATVDRPWLSVFPTSGLIGPAGITLTITADPSSLPNGTWMGTVIVIFGSSTISGRFVPQGTSTTSVPVSINLTTPVKPGALPQLSASALVIPSIGHLAGLSSDWRSDIRVANVGATPLKFQLTFNPGSGDASTPVKQTTILVDAGATTALDDIVRNWFGVGSLGDSSNGMLYIQPLDGSKVSVSTTAVVSSRTYNTQSTSTGTLGQFIPAVPFGNFVGIGGSILTLQQIAQSADYRTNLGVVEAGGKPLSTLVSVFDGGGAKLLDLPVALKAGQQQQLNGFLAAAGINNLTNGHIEVKPVSGDGKATAYASVVDSKSGDPILVSAVPLGGGANRFVVPGIADLNNGAASWRSDVRVFNGGTSPQTATLTFYPLGGGASSTQSLTVSPGQVAALDDILHSLFGITNAGGTLHVTTPANAPLVVTARTFDQTANGTLGQFIPAVTSSDTIGLGDRALQLVQVEDSVRYRTNFGVVETSGKPATVEVAVFLPDSKVQPKAQISLAAFESKQFPIISSLGLGNAYNARISVKVIDGDGKITAYGSVIDMTSGAPTYIPAQ